jgi:hypothetical protein
MGFNLIAKALNGNVTLVSLNLENCEISPKAEEDMQSLFTSMRVLTELNLSGNKIKCKVAKVLSKALLYTAESVLTVLSLNYCDLAKDGLDALFGDLRTNKKLLSLSVDGNPLEEETLKVQFLEALEMNKTLSRLSLADCGLDDFNIALIIKALSLNSTLRTLSLA